MAVSKIQYQNKTAIQNDEDIPRQNKVTDEDMNEIKNVVNNNADELNTTKENVENLQEGQGTANTDIANLKSRVSTLETDNTKNKSDIENLQNDNETNQSNIGELQQKTEQIEENISDIQQEQTTQNKEIEKLQTEVQELNEDIKANAIIEETEKAKSLYIDDANASRGKVNVFGNMEQEIREGYNLLDISEINSTWTQWKTENFKYKKYQLKPNTSYTVSQLKNRPTTGTVSETSYLYITSGEEVAETLSYSINGALVGAPRTVTSDSNGYIIVYAAVNDVTFTNDLGLMLVEGTEEKEYEAYGASPNLNYPSSIKCLGDNKQLFDGIFRQGNEVFTSSSTNVFSSNNISCNKDKDYTISTNLDLTVYRYALFTNTNSFPTNNPVTDSTGYKTESQTTIKSTVDGYIGILIGKKDNSAISPEDINQYYFKLEAGKVATSYSPHGQGSTEIKQYNKNLAESIETFNTSGQFGTMCIAGYTIKKGEKYIISFDTPNSETDCYLQSSNEIKLSVDGGYYYTNLDGTRKSIVVTATETGYFRNTKGIILKRTNDSKETGLISNFMIEKWNGNNKASDYEETKKDIFNIDIQQEMLKGDYFDLERKKEVHNWEKIIFNGTENITKVLDNIYNYTLTKKAKAIINDKTSHKSNKYISAICTGTNNAFVGIATSDYVINLNSGDGMILRIKDIRNLNINDFKASLAQQHESGEPTIVYYKLETPIELDLTDTQIQQLEKLNKLRFYEGVNNIMTLEDIALIQAEYSVNLKDVNNKMRQEIDEIKELLSTTQTSAMLLDNLEEDLIKEVE